MLKDSRVVQQGESQEILLRPNDPYILDFISDINRARVLRVRSIIKALTADAQQWIGGEVDSEATLEFMIALSGGDAGWRSAWR